MTRPRLLPRALLFSLLLALLLLLTLCLNPPQSPPTLPPWQIPLIGGRWAPFGWPLGALAPQDLPPSLQRNLQWALLAPPSAPPFLEAWLPEFDAQGLIGQLLLRFQLPPTLSAEAESHLTRASLTPSGNRRLPFDPLSDPRWREQPTLTLVAFLPRPSLDEATLTARFAHLGDPHKAAAPDHTLLLYPLSSALPDLPSVAVQILIPTRGRTIIEYGYRTHLTPSPLNPSSLTLSPFPATAAPSAPRTASMP
ncbi:MAG: hypothetical protein N2557_02370 [Hydrogenophilus sp.]|nr:hypothetical protein [Hydrogenophilus sp.]